jgi:hypothetical protein
MAPQHLHIDLREAPLLRVKVAADVESANWYVLLQLHHVVNDHESLRIVAEEVAVHLRGKAAELREPAPYRNYIARVLAYERSGKAEEFFRSKLADVAESTSPFGLMDVRGGGGGKEVFSRRVEGEWALRARACARRLRVTPAALFHLVWALVVSRCSNRDDVVFGTVLFGRMQGVAGADRMPGMFLNTLPLRLSLARASVEQLLGRTSRELMELVEHEYASLAVAQRCSGMEGYAPLFSAVLNYRHSRGAELQLGQQDTGIRALELQEFSNYPVMFSVDDFGDAFGLKAVVEGRGLAERMVRYVELGLHRVVDALEHTAGGGEAAVVDGVECDEERFSAREEPAGSVRGAGR